MQQNKTVGQLAAAVLMVVALAFSGVAADRARTSNISVLTVYRGSVSMVSDSYESHDDAVLAARRLKGVDTWAVISTSKFHERRPGGGFGLVLFPSLWAQQALTPSASVVLPPVQRAGEFISPNVTVATGSLLADVTLQMLDADLTSASTAVTSVVEQTPDGGATWAFVCGVTFQGPGPAGRTPEATCSIGGRATTPVRARVTTCAALPGRTCVPTLASISVGATVAIQ